MRAHRNQAEMIERRQMERYVARNQTPGCERCERDALCGDCERLVEDAERDELNEAHAHGLAPAPDAG